MMSKHTRTIWIIMAAGVLILALPLLVSAANGTLDNLITELRQMAQGGRMDPALQRSLEEKVARLEREQADREAAQTHAAEKPQNPDLAAQLPAPDSPRPTGIIENGVAPFSSQDVHMTNLWQEKVNGQWVQVYAGASAARPEQGVVIVMTETNGTTSAERFNTPLREGAVTIVQADGLRLTLQSAAGTVSLFDVSARAFASH